VTTTLERATPLAASGRPAWPRADWLGPTFVLVAYAGSALVIPTLANLAITDDWVYYRSVETLLVQHRLEVPEMSSAALVFQTLWGALFASVFGLSFGALRVSTLVMVGLGGLAVYGLMRQLQVSRAWSTLGMAAYLFHPLSLSLAYTFMTDPHFLALVLIATWLYVRGLRGSAAWLVAGSVVASLAILVRQQGVLIPASVFGALLLGRRIGSPRSGAIVLAQTCAVPAVVFVAFSAWLRYVNGTPYALSLFYDDFSSAGWAGVIELLPRLGIIEATYVGLFVLPIAIAALPATRTLQLGLLRPRPVPGAHQPPPAALERTHAASRGPSREDENALRGNNALRGWRAWLVVGWACVVVGGAVSYWLDGHKAMPYVGQFVTPTGIGPEDLIAPRPMLMQPVERIALTLACVAASIAAAAAVLRMPRVSGAAAIIAAVGVGQVLGTLPSSVHFIPWGGTLDRYLLPLLPFCIVLLLAALRTARTSLALAWLAVAVMGAWSVAGTRDHLAFLDGVWSLASEANAMGIDNLHLDAGAGWDGFHDYQAPPDPAVHPRTPDPQWWAELFAPQMDSNYVIAGDALAGYTVVKQGGYFSWLRQQAMPLYLLRRPGVPGPP
jgi:Dolichyl-phosphate-mannose-protein mannosyltransferase